MDSHVAPWPVLLVVGLFAAAIFWWFYLVTDFFKYMSHNHPAKYQEMGSPTLIWNNNIRNSTAFTWFIIGSQYKTLNDATLWKKCSFLKIFFYTYLAAFLCLFLGIPLLAYLQ